MKKVSFSDPKLGGLVSITANLPLATINGYVRFDVVRPVTATLTNSLGLSLAVAKDGTTTISALHAGIWVEMKKKTVPNPSSLILRKTDAFVWELSVTSGLDQALSLTTHLDMQADFVPLDTQLSAERSANVTIDLIVNGTTDISNLEIKAEKNVW
jgi:hypothetical protein